MIRIRSPKDFWSGLIFVAIGLGFVLLAQSYRLGTMHRMGPGMFPMLVGSVLAGLGIVIILRALAFVGDPLPRFQARPLAISLFGIVAFGLALQWLGLAAAVVALVLIGGCASPQVRLRENVLLAAAMVVFSIAVFVWLLGLPLPVWPGT